jgi:ankyrin repeat protein
MQEDPGRQMMTGSFHPIDEGEWSIQAYLGPVEKLFRAVGEGDLETVRDIVEGGFDLQRRDHVGRTALHLAIIAKYETISSYLIDSGARITARLVDGRTSLHLAAQLGLKDIASKLIDKSKQNERKAEEDKAAAEAAKEKEKKDDDGDSEMGDNRPDKEDDENMNPSSEDDWDSDGEPRKKKKIEAPAPTNTVNDPPAEGSAIPEDNEELPDILDINVVDWDFMYSPLSHAIVAGHAGVVDVLIRAGADVTTPFKKGATWAQVTFYPLALTLLTEDKKAACAIAERLLENGASCTAADESLKTVFHQAVLAKNVDLVKTFIRVDPNAKTAMDFLPQISWNEVAGPLVSAVGLNERAIAILLISSGASVKITPEMFDRSWDARYSVGNKNRYIPQKQEGQWLKETNFPVESALAQRNDLVIPMIQLGADLNLGLRADNQYNQSK